MGKLEDIHFPGLTPNMQQRAIVRVETLAVQGISARNR